MSNMDQTNRQTGEPSVFAITHKKVSTIFVLSLMAYLLKVATRLASTHEQIVQASSGLHESVVGAFEAIVDLAAAVGAVEQLEARLSGQGSIGSLPAEDTLRNPLIINRRTLGQQPAGVDHQS